MQMPERARIRALKEEVIKRIEEANVRNFPGCEGKLFLIRRPIRACGWSMPMTR